MARKVARSGSKPFSASTDAQTSRKPNHRANRASKTDPSAAYTYLPTLPKRHRTSAQTLSLSRDEAGPSNPPRRRGKDVEENSDDDMQARIRKVAMMIAEDGPGAVESEESDVDSDEAWEEDGSDEERWGDIFRDLQKGKGRKGKSKAPELPAKPLTVNLDESDEGDDPGRKRAASVPASFEADEDDEELEDEDEEQSDASGISGVGAEDAWAGIPSDDEREGSSVLDAEEAEQDEENEDEEVADDDEDSEEGSEGSDLEMPSDLSDDEEGPDTLDGLDAFVDQLASDDKKRKAGGDEPTATKKRKVLPVISGPALGEGSNLSLTSTGKIGLASLLASHPSLSTSSARALLPTSKTTTSSVLKQGVLPAPLPTVVQDRLNREAAYEKTKEEGAKWSTLMKRVKEAEHLQFPLQGTDRGGVKSGGEMLASFKASNEHESAVQALLAKANLTDKGVKAAEEEALQGQDLSMEEIAERRSQLRQQRELMFREEARAKRVSKIKSKTFRKLARKRAEKATGDVDLDDLDPEEAEAEREKLERQRAKERATLKHSARTSKWARDSGMGETEDKRRAKEEMLEMKERLKRRIAGKGDQSSEEESDSEVEQDEKAIRARAFDQLADLDQEDANADAGSKGLANMVFMKKARERQRQQAKDSQEAVRRDIELFGNDAGSEDDGDEEEDRSEQTSMMKVGGNEGRMVFSGPAPGTSAVPPQPKTNGLKEARLEAALRFSPSPPPVPESNPWLTSTGGAGPSRKRNTVVNANSKIADKASASLKKAKAAARGDTVDDETVEIETDGNKLLKQQVARNGGGDVDDEDELMPVNKRVGFKQRDLVGEAFAGDNVVDDFAREKAKVVQEDAPKVEDTSLAGWGSWGGKGARKRRTDPKFLKTTAGIDATERKDAGRTNVIISEKKNKKASAYQVKDLPYPYTSVAQYEARFTNPLGSEWNSRAMHQKETLPRVTKKRGAIIEPVRRLF